MGVVFILRGLLSRQANTNSLPERAEREHHSRFPVIAQRERSQIQDLSAGDLFPASSGPASCAARSQTLTSRLDIATADG